MDKTVTVRKQVQLEEWSEMVRECQSSGLSARKWCMENGINPHTYYGRLKKVREAYSPQQHDIVPVVYNETTSADIKIQSGNMNISMPCSASPEILRAAIEALKC